MSTTEEASENEITILYTNHHGWLKRWLYRKLGNSFDAADLAHDIFMRLLAREQSTVIHQPRALLTTIAQGIVSNFYRRRKIETAYLETLAHLPEAQAPDPEIRVILLETLIEIDRRLDMLAPLVRRTFLLSQVDGMRQTDIAAELNLSLATVQRYIVKAVHQCYFGE